jgi:2'-5' RNA ligase
MDITDVSKYFIAIVPPSPIYEEINQLKEYCKENFNTKGALNSPPHLTLLMPFRWKEAKEDRLFTSLASFVKTETPFEILASGFWRFEPRVIYISIQPNLVLNQFRNRLQLFFRKELNVLNADYRGLPFHPHITIAFRDLKKSMFAKAWQEFSSKKFEAVWQVNVIVLLKNEDNQWRVLKEFALQPNATTSKSLQ